MFTEACGVRVFYEIRGETGSNVVLLHGWGCSAKMMESLADRLMKNHRVMVLDFPGHGQSGRPTEPWGVPEFSACLKDLLEQTHFVPCAVVGHSFGCRIAAWSASE